MFVSKTTETEFNAQPSLSGMTFDERQSVVGLFELLLKIDKRINPQNYEYEDKGSLHSAD